MQSVILLFIKNCGSTLSQCMCDDILTSIQRWFSNVKLKLIADKIEYMISRKCKIVNYGLLVYQKMVTTLNR